MIQALLDLPAGGLFAALVTLYAATAGFIFWLAFASPARGVVSGLQGVVPPFTASIGVLFALLTGFLANDVGRRNEQAVQAVMDLDGKELTAKDLWQLFEREYALSAPAPTNATTSGQAGGSVRVTADVDWAGAVVPVQGEGNGPIDAFVNALNAATGRQAG